jgi:hypothetical protein
MPSLGWMLFGWLVGNVVVVTCVYVGARLVDAWSLAPRAPADRRVEEVDRG